MADDFERLAREAHELGKATLHAPVSGTPQVFGSAAFFKAATETLVQSTREERELGGACYFVKRNKSLVLVGLRQMTQGQAEHVAIDPAWGSVLWHSHPGLSFSIAAFSRPDVEGARLADRALLVIGYRVASPDVLGLTQVVNMMRETDDAMMDQLLRMGVAARVVWPNGSVRPVRTFRASGLREVVDDATFQIDRAIGMAARQLEGPAIQKISGQMRRAMGDARKRAREAWRNKG